MNIDLHAWKTKFTNLFQSKSPANSPSKSNEIPVASQWWIDNTPEIENVEQSIVVATPFSKIFDNSPILSINISIDPQFLGKMNDSIKRTFI